MLPKIIHFIWAGGNKILPETPNADVIKAWAKSVEEDPDFRVILWVDNKTTDTESINEYKNLEYFKNYHNIEIKDIEEYRVDPYISYEIDKLRPNYGASSDMLRYQILYNYGGAYFDSDVRPSEKKENTLVSLYRKYAQYNEDIFITSANSQGRGHIGNDNFICTPRHPYFQELTLACQNNYKNIPIEVYQYDKENYIRDTTVKRTGSGALEIIFEDKCQQKVHMGTPSNMPKGVKILDDDYFTIEGKKHDSAWVGVKIRYIEGLDECLDTVLNTIKFEAAKLSMLRMEDHVNNILESIKYKFSDNEAPYKREIIEKIIGKIEANKEVIPLDNIKYCQLMLSFPSQKWNEFSRNLKNINYRDIDHVYPSLFMDLRSNQDKKEDVVLAGLSYLDLNIDYITKNELEYDKKSQYYLESLIRILSQIEKDIPHIENNNEYSDKIKMMGVTLDKRLEGLMSEIQSSSDDDWDKDTITATDSAPSSPDLSGKKQRLSDIKKALSGAIINNSDSDDDLQMEEDAKINHLSDQAEQTSSGRKILDASSIKELPNNKDSRNNKTKSISADKQLEKMADVQRKKMAASAFGQGSNTAKEMASFQKKKSAVSVGARGYNVKNKAIETKKQDTNLSKTGYTR